LRFRSLEPTRKSFNWQCKSYKVTEKLQTTSMHHNYRSDVHISVTRKKKKIDAGVAWKCWCDARISIKVRYRAKKKNK
jgi:hypothetical protein